MIHEFTVYPGATEEVCVPVLEKISGLSFNKDFLAGYSPERINPGGKEHRVASITKVTFGSPKPSKELWAYLKGNGVLFGLKDTLPRGEADSRL